MGVDLAQEEIGKDVVYALFPSRSVLEDISRIVGGRRMRNRPRRRCPEKNSTERIGSLLPAHRVQCVERTYGVIFYHASISTPRMTEKYVDNTKSTHCKLGDSSSSVENLCF